jgi:hypothetical protein
MGPSNHRAANRDLFEKRAMKRLAVGREVAPT